MGEGVRRVTIHDVAGKAGVSTAAVSHAFNDPERLRATTWTRILDAARELGYAPNPHARALHSRRVGVLGVLFPQPIATVFANPFFASFLEGIGSVTDERGIGLLTVTPVGGSLERAIAAAPVDGFVIIGLDERNPDVAPLRKRGVPFVVVDGDAETASSVNVDDEGGAHAAAEFLLERGHREVLVLTFHAPPDELDKDLGVRGRRLRGYRRAFVERGLSLDDDAVVRTFVTLAGGDTAFAQAWAGGGRAPPGAPAQAHHCPPPGARRQGPGGPWCPNPRGVRRDRRHNHTERDRRRGRRRDNREHPAVARLWDRRFRGDGAQPAHRQDPHREPEREDHRSSGPVRPGLQQVPDGSRGGRRS